MFRSAVARYLIRRVGVYLLTIFGSFTIAFIFFRLIPGDPVRNLFAALEQEYRYSGEVSVGMLEHYREQLGLEGSLPEQYLKYLSNVLLRFDLGPSLTAFPTPSQELILRAMPWTIGLLGISVVIAWILGVIAGGLLGWFRNAPASNYFITIAIGMSQIPQYIVALLLLFVFAFTFTWLPTRNAYPANATPSFSMDFFVGVLRHGILPAMSIIMVSLAGWMLSTRSLVVTILGEDYLLYAEAKGLPRQQIFGNYIMRNALLPQVTALAISLGFIVNGALLIETLFNYPGLGSLLVRAIAILDYNTIQGIVLISIVSVLTANLLLDLLLPFIDPRIRTGGG